MSLRGGCSSRRSNFQINEKIASGKEQERPRNDEIIFLPIPCLLTRRSLAGIIGKVILGRERYDGYGVPEGLPLIVRFSNQTLKVFTINRVQNLQSKPLGSKAVSSISQWRTLVLVNFDSVLYVIARSAPALCDEAISIHEEIASVASLLRNDRDRVKVHALSFPFCFVCCTSFL